MRAGLLILVLVSGLIGAHAAPIYVEVQSLVNVDFVGTYGSVFPAVSSQGPFHEMMFLNQGNGAAVGDYDSDGDLDIYLLGQLNQPNVLLRNDLDLGSEWFTDVTATAGVGDLGLSRVAHFVDLNNDGHLDLLLINDDDGSNNYSPSRIFENNGDGTFFDRTSTANFRPTGYLRCGAAVADYDRDGLLDVYVTNWGFAGVGGSPDFPGVNRLYRNLGNFTFQDVTGAVGLGGLARDSFSAILHDFDGDHFPDLYVALDNSSDEFYWNQSGTFVNETSGVGLAHVGTDMGISCADFDDDGDLDLYVTNISDPDGAFGPSQGNPLHVNRADTVGSTQFVDEAVLRGAGDTAWGWGVEFVDWDNDGDLDIVAGNGFDEFVEFVAPGSSILGTPTVLLENDSTGNFTRVFTPDLNVSEDSRALIAFDYDRDGDEDLLITNMNQPARLLENRTATQGHWLDVTAVQSAGSNRNAVGAAIYATVGPKTMRRDFIVGDSFLAGTPSEVHFGLGVATTVDSLEVHWTDGNQTTYPNVYGDRLIQIVQGAADADLDGVPDLDDCEATDGSAWDTPGAVDDLRLGGGAATELTWSVPDDAGSFAPTFDVVRSSSPEMSAAWICLADAVSNTTVSDGGLPPGGIYFYGVRVENGCGAAVGPASTTRSWPSCP